MEAYIQYMSLIPRASQFTAFPSGSEALTPLAFAVHDGHASILAHILHYLVE